MEVYSTQMQAAVQHQVQQAPIEWLCQLLAYYRQRGGPGLALVETELRERQARRLLNYSPQPSNV